MDFASLFKFDLSNPKDWIKFGFITGGIVWIFKELRGGGTFGQETDLAFKRPRYGQPKTQAERRATHEQEYGTGELPPRGTGQEGMVIELDEDY